MRMAQDVWCQLDDTLAASTCMPLEEAKLQPEALR